jgi:DNA polymerase I
MAPTLLAVDLSYQTYRAAAANPGLTSRRVFTGGLYGFFVVLAKTIRETGATDVVVCRDTKPYRRSGAYPNYKQLRKQRADDELLRAYNQSITLVLEVLDAIGVPVWACQGFESDDLIALAATRYRHRFERIYAASNDSDLYQLLDVPNFGIYTKSIADVVTATTVAQRTGLTPQEYTLATALQGTHNDIAGIPGVGEVRARRAVLDPALMRKYMDSYGDIIRRNQQLIKLPHAELPTGLRLPRAVRGLDERQLYRSLGKYDIDTTASMVNALRQVLKEDNT